MRDFIIYQKERIWYAKDTVSVFWDFAYNLWSAFILWLSDNRAFMVKDRDPGNRGLKFFNQPGQEKIAYLLADYSEGHGSQGDAIRIYNYIHLVWGIPVKQTGPNRLL